MLIATDETQDEKGKDILISKYLQDIIDGEYPTRRQLQKNNDISRDFYALFEMMVNTLKDRDKGIKY